MGRLLPRPPDPTRAAAGAGGTIDGTIGEAADGARPGLRAEFRDWTREAIEAAARAGDRDRMTEPVTHVRFAHSGDARRSVGA